jgi:trigger factor
MQISVEQSGGLERRMTVTVPSERMSSEVDKRLNQLKGRVKIHGFRKGKVPMSVVRQQYGAAVRSEVAGEVIQSSFNEAVGKESLRPAGMPNIESVDDKDDGLTFTAVFEVYPEVQVADFASIEVSRPQVEIADADVDAMIDKLRSQRKVFDKVERAAEDGDQLTVSFRGTMNGEEFKGNAAENVPVVLGSGALIAGFEAGLVGAKAGDDVTLNLTFPEAYQNKDLAGKPVEFKVQVHEVAGVTLPELTDEFLTEFGVSEGGIAAFKEQVLKNMNRERDQAVRRRVKDQVMDALVAANPMDIPKAMVREEARRMLGQITANMSGQGRDDLFKAEMFEPQAERRVHLGLLMAEIVRANEVSADKDRVRAFIDEMASAYEKPEDVVNWYYSNPQRLAEAEMAVMEEQIVELVTTKATVKDEKTDFESLMKSVDSAGA